MHGRDESLPYDFKIKRDVNRYGCGPGMPSPYEVANREAAVGGKRRRGQDPSLQAGGDGKITR